MSSSVPLSLAPTADAPLAEPPDACDNCGHPVVEDYCAACGQKAVAFQRPIHHLGREVVADYFGFDGKLWRTLVPLFLRPGFLTHEYLDGRRNQYVRPVRLYLTASITLFFLLSVLPEGGFLAGAVNVQDRSVVPDSLAAPSVVEAQPLESNLASLQAAERELAALDSARAALAVVRDSLREVVAGEGVSAERVVENEESGGFWYGLGEEVGRKGGKVGEMGQEGAEQWFVDSFTSNMPKAMFVLLPIFALLLKLFYARRGRYYGEHLVFALHTHAFAFFTFTALALLLAVTGDVEAIEGPARVVIGTVILGLLASIPLHILLALKRVYRQGWVRTGLKWSALMATYTVVLGLGVVGVVLVAFLLL